ncbi:LPD7 domain-containing protein [Burkholderia diffusa]|uniref:LPD7 domain-containing protein n=1 Tax=Burkholderia diffusa TaxID=488732 RepID=UPI001CAAD108|nr:LPD7 domain-containing protein [Burkholderia diffusa]CAG9264296.1 LPD7 domain-containing protein [Burkholderia diffusa]
MLIRPFGRHDGVKQYLEDGQKLGRELGRDELDERVVLAGDLDVTDMVIQSINVAPNVDRYLSITLSFKEDHVDRATLQAIVDEFERFAMHAYRSDEYCFYAEAHLPRVKSYVDQKSGELVERKPHIHVVIPKTNLISGGALRPFGFDKLNLSFIDAFQEHINAKYGLASPKDNRRVELTDASEMIARYRGDLFRATSRDLKEQLLDAILDRKIERHEDFMSLLREHGDVRMRNAGRDNAYPNVKPAGAEKGVNLKEYVFSPAFIEMPTDEKLRALSADAADRYEAVGAPRSTPDEIRAVLDEWYATRAFEVKYLNSGSRTYRLYQDSSAHDRELMLAELERGFYAQHLKDFHERADERIPGLEEHLRQLGRLYDFGGGRSPNGAFPDFQRGAGFGPDAGDTRRGPGARPIGIGSSIGDPFDAIHRQFDFVPDRTPSTARPGDGLRDLPGVALDGIAHRPAVLVPDHALHELEPREPVPAYGLRRDTDRDGEFAAQRVTGRVADSVVSQLARDGRQEHAMRGHAGEFAEIRRNLDAHRLLAELSHTHGVRPAKYAVVAGKDGSPRIRAGKRHLNVSDFLTKELNIPWSDAAALLRSAYQHQLAGDRVPSPRELPRAALWRAYSADRDTYMDARREAWAGQRASELNRRTVLSADWSRARTTIKDDRRLQPAERKAALSIARVTHLGREDALREAIAHERSELKRQYGTATGPSFAEWLQAKAQQGDERALDELRRTAAPAVSATVDLDGEANEIRPHAPASTPQAEHNAILFRSSALSWRVDERGTVTYQRDGLDVLRDRGPNVQVLVPDRAAIEAGLRLAQSKFGSTLELGGHDAFQLAAAKVAVDAGLQIQFSDARLNQAMNQYRALRVDQHLRDTLGSSPIATPRRPDDPPALDHSPSPDDLKPKV